MANEDLARLFITLFQFSRDEFLTGTSVLGLASWVTCEPHLCPPPGDKALTLTFLPLLHCYVKVGAFFCSQSSGPALWPRSCSVASSPEAAFLFGGVLGAVAGDRVPQAESCSGDPFQTPTGVPITGSSLCT